MNKRRGSFYEYKFFAEAMKKDLDVFVPAGDHLPVDCLVTNEKGTIFKVQVKGTCSKCLNNRVTPRYKVTAATGSKTKVPIDCKKVDILAVYIEPHDIFYIIPCNVLGQRTSPWFYPETENSKGQFELYKEDWTLFN